MRWLLVIAASIATSTTLGASAMPRSAAQAARDASPRVVLDNPRVRAYRTTAGSPSGVDHGPAVVVTLEDGLGQTAGSAVWVEDAAAPGSTSNVRGSIVIVQPRRQAAATSPPPAGSKPGGADSEVRSRGGEATAMRADFWPSMIRGPQA